MLRWIIQTNGSSEHFALEKTGYSIKHQLTESQKYVDENGNIDDTYLDALLPWSKELPDECRKIRHKKKIVALIKFISAVYHHHMFCAR